MNWKVKLVKVSKYSSIFRPCTLTPGWIVDKIGHCGLVHYENLENLCVESCFVVIALVKVSQRTSFRVNLGFRCFHIDTLLANTNFVSEFWAQQGQRLFIVSSSLNTEFVNNCCIKCHHEKVNHAHQFIRHHNLVVRIFKPVGVILNNYLVDEKQDAQ